MLSLSWIYQKIDTSSLQKQMKQSKVMIMYVMVDINCGLKLVFKDGSGKFFTDIMILK